MMQQKGWYRWWWIMGALIGNWPVLLAQSDPSPAYFRDEYPQEQHQPMPIDRASWERSIKDLQYFRTERKKDQAAEPPRPTSLNWPKGTAQRWMQIGFGLILLLLVVVGFWVYRQQPRNRKVKKSPSPMELDFAAIEANLATTDLRTLLERATAAGQYPLAVRLYYLLVLQRLNARKLIRWEIHAPNRTYLLQLRLHPAYADFAALTLRFERVRYGAEPVSREAFNQHTEAFETFLHTWAPEATTTVVEA